MAIGTDMFALAERRLAYIDQRQRVLAQNIANANTPDYQARDLTPFEKMLLQTRPVTPVLTDPRHLQGRVQEVAYARTVPEERAPDGNAVNIETELTKVADDETNAALAGNLWKSYMGLYLSALGKA